VIRTKDRAAIRTKSRLRNATGPGIVTAVPTVTVVKPVDAIVGQTAADVIVIAIDGTGIETGAIATALPLALALARYPALAGAGTVADAGGTATGDLTGVIAEAGAGVEAAARRRKERRKRRRRRSVRGRAHPAAAALTTKRQT